MDTILISVISGLIGVFAMFINSKLCNTKYNKKEYIKIFLLIFLILVLVQYYITNKKNLLVGGGSTELEVDIDDPNF